MKQSVKVQRRVMKMMPYFCCEEEKTKTTQQKELRKWFDFVVFVCNKDLDEITKCE